MKNFLGLINSLRLIHWLILLTVGFMGFAGTFSIGHHLEKKAVKSWIRQAQLDVAVATIAAQSWLAQSETMVSGLALGLQHSDEITADEFKELVLKAEDWNSEFSLDAVAIVRRVLRPERDQIEQSLNQPLSHANDASKTAPDAFAHMVVTHSSETEGPLRPATDLLTVDKMGVVPSTAQRIPDKAVMGPAYASDDGRLHTLVGVGSLHGDLNTIIVGEVDLSEMIDTLLKNHLPDGIVLRLSERDTEAQVDTLVHPIYGTLEPASNVELTVPIRVTRGQARWNYNWDITDKYLGGAPTANVTMFQIGGLIITILVVYSIALLSVQNVIIKRTVEERTKKLTDEMVERKVAEASLRTSRDTLEQRVASRTTELQQAMQEIVEANQAKSDFIASMSHELRTPLNAMLGFAAMIARQYAGPVGNDKYVEYAEYIENGDQHLLGLVNDILDVERIEAGKYDLKKEVINVNEVVSECILYLNKLAEQGGVSLDAEVADDIATLYADRRALLQVLVNIVTNAIKFTPERGSVVLVVTTSGSHHEFEIRDTGIGISKEQIPVLTDPFTRHEPDPHKTQDGVGLGLAICDSLIKLHNGTMMIESDVGKGTIVIVTIPSDKIVEEV